MKIIAKVESCFDCQYLSDPEYCGELHRVIALTEEELFDIDCPLSDVPDQVEPDRDRDLKCLLEMQNLLKDTIYRADGAKTQLLSEMIADWINELLKPEGETK